MGMADGDGQRIGGVGSGKADAGQHEFDHMLDLFLGGVADPDHGFLDGIGGVFADLEPGLEPARRMAEKVRAAGHSAVDGRFIPGLKAISAPILNWQGEAEAALTITTGDQGLLEPDGPALELLIATCRELSALAPQDSPAEAAN